MVIEQVAIPEPFVTAPHVAEPTWIVTASPAGIASPFDEVTLAVKLTGASAP